MTKRKFTDEEVITELKSASEWFNKHGKNTNTAIVGICDRAVDLINRMNAEIVELESEIDKQYEQAKADILGNMADGGTSCHWCIEQHEAKAIKEFAEEFEKRCLASGIYPVLIKNILKNLVKEKTEGQE